MKGNIVLVIARNNCISGLRFMRKRNPQFNVVFVLNVVYERIISFVNLDKQEIATVLCYFHSSENFPYLSYIDQVFGLLVITLTFI